jgi:hypothetical protein
MAEAARQSSERELTPLAEVLGALAQELESARSTGMRVEAAFCAHAVNSQLDGSVIRDMQQLDGVLQHLAALRDFVAALATDAHGEACIAAALERVSLGDVRARLQGRDGAQPEGETEMWAL